MRTADGSKFLRTFSSPRYLFVLACFSSCMFSLVLFVLFPFGPDKDFLPIRMIFLSIISCLFLLKDHRISPNFFDD